MINLLAIRTHYPQWATRSGINQYLNHLDPRLFKVSERLVPMGNSAVPAPVRYMKKPIKQAIAKRGNRIYDVDDFYAELKVCKQVLFGKTDIIQYFDPEHSLNYLPTWLKGALFPKRKRPLIIGMFHQPSSVLVEIMSPTLVRDLDHIILMSSEQKTFFAAHYPEEKISVILHGIDTAFYQPDYVKRDSNKFRCVTVGHWLRDYDTLEMVADSLVDKHDIEFHVVSSVRLKKNLGNVIFHSGISDSALLHLYQQSNLLFMPFKDSTANNAILEGMACGLPVLTTDLTATREYLRNADAVFVKDNTIQDFNQAILDFVRLSKENKQQGEKSRTRALELSWTDVSRQYEALYLDLMHRKI